MILQNKHHNHEAGNPRPSIAGGLLLSLDLSRAFDCVDRIVLMQALRHMGVQDSHITFLEAIYANTSFQFTHRDESRSVPTWRGIRQGCKSAPMLWCIFTGYLLELLGVCTSTDWMLHCNTLYADDWATYKMFTDVTQLDETLQNIGKMFDLFENMGLQVNTSKTLVLLSMRGIALKKMQARHTKKLNDGIYLIIPRQVGAETLIKIVKSLAYFGVTLSYSQFEKQTIDMRIKQARKTSFSLNRWLTGGGGLTLHHRYKIWKQCVLPCLLHGLHYTGFTRAGIQQMDVFIFQQIRRIFQKIQKCERTSHAQFLHDLNLGDPLDIVRRRCSDTITKLQKRYASFPANDIVLQHDYSRLVTGLQVLDGYLLEGRPSTQRISETPLLKPLVCPFCDASFQVESDLKSHLTSRHEFKLGRLRVLSLLHDARNGLPTCNRCGGHFTTWPNLKHHVEYVCTCPLPQDDAGIAAFRRLQKDLLSHAASDLQGFKTAQELQKWFAHRCSICNRYCENSKALMKHHLNERPHEYQVHHAFYQRLVQIASQFQMFSDPCSLCCAKVKKYHCCMIIRQMAMLQGHEILTADDQSKHVYSTSDDFPIYKCDICGESYRSAQGLDARMITHEAADGFLFDAARDAGPDQTCLHCNERFSSYQAVMGHIQNGHCDEFDEDKPIVTLLDFHPSLRSLIEEGRISLILQNPDMVKLFDEQCTICQKPLDRRHSLQNHLTTVHGKHWKNAQALANGCATHFKLVKDGVTVIHQSKQ